MIQRTLADVLPVLRRVASQAGLRADDPRLIEMINDATEQLLTKVPNAVGTMHRVKFCQYDKQIALPAYYSRLLKASVDRANAPIMDKWYEFMDFGPGHLDQGPGINVLVDRGEAPVVRQSVSEPALVRCYGYVDERKSGVRPKIRVMGYDENGIWLRTNNSGVWTDGEEIEINGDSSTNYATSVKKFSRITQVIKPVTNGTVELYFYSPDAETPLAFAARYEFWETNPTFRLYLASAIGDDQTAQFHGICKVRFRPMRYPTDKLIVSSLPALKKAIRALALEDADNIQGGNINWSLAAQILREEANEYYGSPKPAIDVTSAGSTFGDIPNIQ